MSTKSNDRPITKFEAIASLVVCVCICAAFAWPVAWVALNALNAPTELEGYDLLLLVGSLFVPAALSLFFGSKAYKLWAYIRGNNQPGSFSFAEKY